MHRLFPTQTAEEKIYIAVREHWIRLTLKIGIWAIFLAVLIAFYVIAPESAPILFQGTAGLVTELATQVYTMFLAVSLFIIIVLYYLNLHIITNIRIVDIDQEGLFHHVISELHIEKIEDVTSQTSGVLGNIFGFGTVLIQTAGTTERFEFENVPNPDKLVKIILDLYELNDAKELHKGKPSAQQET